MNHIYILVATQGDGSPFHPDSFQEEDVVELCMGLSQAYLEGMLRLLDTEAVLSFWSSSEMMAMMCLLAVAMAWCDEPIRLHICPPTGTQVREYVALRGKHPYGIKVQPPDVEVVSQSSPSDPQGPWLQPHLAIRDLDDAKLR